VNDVDAVLGQGGYLVDQDARFTFAPASAGSLGGFPAFAPGERFIVITKNGAPAWVPVTQQEYLDLRIAEERKSFADVKTSLAALPESPSKANALARAEGRVRGLEAELAALSDAARRAPALMPDDFPTTRASFLAEPGTLRTRAIVKPNPALFDARQLRTAVQLIVIGSVRYNSELFTKVQEQLDVAELAKMIE
jgi:hypothetical protein